MSFFKDLKEDIAQSMNELSDSLDENFLKEGEKAQVVSDENMTGTVSDETVPTGEMVTDFDGYAQTSGAEIPEAAGVQDFKVAENLSQPEGDSPDTDALAFDIPDLEAKPEASNDTPDSEAESEISFDIPQAESEAEAISDITESGDASLENDMTDLEPVSDLSGLMPEAEVTEDVSVSEDFSDLEPAFDYNDENTIISQEESADMDTMNEEFKMPEEPVTDTAAVEDEEPEVTIITKGTTINGGIKSDTSLVVKGTIEGDVECDGKLTITGRVSGNTIASEIYVNTPRLEGDINSKGIVKIDVGTVVIGNISCTSVLVSGAVKGNIEVNGPVIIDSTAVVKGDIKAKSIQINSGAVIDGHCSLQYADIDLDSFFE